jgi:hypothetical protein
MTGHLIHIGYPKAASTFLQRWFERHPQLAYKGGGIAGFQNVYEIVKQGVAPRQGILYRVTSYEALLAPNRRAAKIVPDYRGFDFTGAQRSVCAILSSLFPNARVLIVTRGFRSIILSAYSQYVRSGGEATLESRLAAGTQLRRGKWQYDALIDLYAKAFGAENVIVLPYELLRDDSDAFLRALEERLGLEHFAGYRDERFNPSLSPVELYWYPRLTRAVRKLPVGARLRRLYARAAFVNRFRIPIAVLQRLRPGQPVTAELIPDEAVNAFRGQAESLRGNPLYAPYARDYLFQVKGGSEELTTAFCIEALSRS